MNPNSNTAANEPEVIDTEGVVIEEDGQAMHSCTEDGPNAPAQNRPSAKPEAKKPQEKCLDPKDYWKGYEGIKLEADLARLDSGWRATQIVRLMTRVGKELVMMDPEVRANLDPEEIRQAQLIAYRTAANFTIGVLDVIPAGIGEAASWSADAMKVAKKVFLAIKSKIKSTRTKFPAWMDLTPDVPISVAVASEAIEPFTGGWVPTHLVVEFPWQLRADAARLIIFLKKILRIKAYIKDYRDAQTWNEQQATQMPPAPEPCEEEKIIAGLQALMEQEEARIADNNQ